jgi:hypothetical protein
VTIVVRSVAECDAMAEASPISGYYRWWQWHLELGLLGCWEKGWWRTRHRKSLEQRSGPTVRGDVARRRGHRRSSSQLVGNLKGRSRRRSQRRRCIKDE